MVYPYVCGTTLHLRSHRPPQPFGDADYKAPFNRDPLVNPSSEMKKYRPRDYVFTKLSRERAENSTLPDFATPYFDTEDSLRLKISKTIAVHSERGPQVVLCDVQTKPSKYWANMGYQPADRPSQVVAKIFDPLHWPDLDPRLPFKRLIDLVSAADKAYAQEAVAYMELHHAQKSNNLITGFVPKFYGTWTLLRNQSKSQKGAVPHETRPVRVVLMEYIDGTDIFSMCSTGYYNPPLERARLITPTRKTECRFSSLLANWATSQIVSPSWLV